MDSTGGRGRDGETLSVAQSRSSSEQVAGDLGNGEDVLTQEGA